jgi:hypothetical protein
MYQYEFYVMGVENNARKLGRLENIRKRNPFL